MRVRKANGEGLVIGGKYIPKREALRLGVRIFKLLPFKDVSRVFYDELYHLIAQAQLEQSWNSDMEE